MARNSRQAMLPFGGSGSSTNFAQFGSQAANAPVKTKAIPTIQALSAYLQGWQSAVALGEAPYLEDMNALFYLYAYQLVYMFQEGIPEWETGTTYNKGSIVKVPYDGSNVNSECFVSLIDANTGNALPTYPVSDSNWAPFTNTPKAPTVQKFGAGSGTYTLPAKCLYIKVRMVGAGGGGAGSTTIVGNNAGNGNAGADTTFGAALTANGGSGGIANSGPSGGAGGGASIGAGPVGFNTLGSAGGSGGVNSAASSFNIGGVGGTSPFGGAGAPLVDNAGANAGTNTGSGGGGASAPSTGYGGGGGGAGGYIEAIINSPAATIAYVVGAKGTGGTAGSSGFPGGNGGDGFLYVEEFYQ